MKLQYVDPYMVRVPEKTVRYLRDPEWIKVFMNSVVREGVLTPIRIYPADDFAETGEYELIDGFTRLFAARLQKKKQIPALIVDKPERPVDEEAYILNAYQRGLDPISMAQYIEKTLKKNMMDWVKTEAEIGISEMHMRRLLKLLSLPEEAKRQIALGEWSIRQALEEIGSTQHSVRKEKKKGGFGLRCAICGRWPEKPENRAWILICREHEAELDAVLQFIATQGWKLNSG